MAVVAIASRRRTQEERSTSTRGRILEAALACLAELGYAGTTTIVVAERAGVSRGAQLHHFPTRASLISATVQYLFTQLTAAYATAFARVAPGSDRVAAGVDLLWEIFQDPRLTAVLELYVAARTDNELRRELLPIAARHHENVLRLARGYFPEAAAANPRFAELLHVVIDALQGLAVRRLVTARPKTLASTVALVKNIARRALAAGRHARE
ncbi:MAG: TetR family transcriptional regulator [Deltaproteobacteria bacterium]|nr:TetR family transcriptional regulator [Deltaproteobacteria bacterium]